MENKNLIERLEAPGAVLLNRFRQAPKADEVNTMEVLEYMESLYKKRDEPGVKELREAIDMPAKELLRKELDAKQADNDGKQVYEQKLVAIGNGTAVNDFLCHRGGNPIETAYLLGMSVKELMSKGVHNQAICNLDLARESAVEWYERVLEV